jgi:hypothetical protein
MTQTHGSPTQVEGATLTAVLERVRAGRRAAVDWLTARVDDDGRPEQADVVNSWWRAPWALVVAGAPDVAAAMLGWAEREALQDDGDFRPGPFRQGIVRSPVYGLSPVAIAAWLLGRYGTANTVADCMRGYQDPDTGGIREFRPEDGRPGLQDNLKTAQYGFSALVMGDRAASEGVATWLRRTYDLQPDLPHRYYPTRDGSQLITDFAPSEALSRVVDLREPRQLYFHPGIAAAFLAGWAQQTGDEETLQLGRDYLALSTQGTSAQFDDISSVQICKYGWGASAMLTADPHGGHLPAVVRMAKWFCDRQRPDGSWAPASFMVPDPALSDLYWKTAEHTMELAYIEHALLSAVTTDTTRSSKTHEETVP